MKDEGWYKLAISKGGFISILIEKIRILQTLSVLTVSEASSRLEFLLFVLFVPVVTITTSINVFFLNNFWDESLTEYDFSPSTCGGYLIKTNWSELVMYVIATWS